MPRTIITVARQMGSGGDLIAAQLAEALKVQLVERQILEGAAAAAGVSPETVSQAEQVSTLLQRALEYLALTPAEVELDDFSTDRPFAAPLMKDAYRHLIEQVILRTAEETDAVIVAHGGFLVLREVPYVLKVLICAPQAVRELRLQEHEGLPQQEAARRIREDDRARADYFRVYYKVDWLQPDHYDLCVNTAHMDASAAVQLIQAAYDRMLREPRKA